MPPSARDPVILTGATGFVGRAVRARCPDALPLSLAGPDWRDRLAATPFAGARVIHLGARVHDPTGSEARFHEDNAVKTRALAEAAASRGAASLVIASTVKVFGEESPGRPFGERDEPHPEDAYARSKRDAERGAREVADAKGLRLAILRIPLVWGPGVGANFRALLSLAARGLPLPFASIANRRSLVHVEDLADALLLAAVHDGAAGRAWCVAQPDPVSTPGLVKAMRRAMGSPARLFACPVSLLEALAGLAGRGALMRRLTRSLEMDAAPFMAATGWRPSRSPDSAMADTVAAWRAAGATP
jgi:nucleoside-diphosphate-sugar epimerase